jgi:hypothetical protein
MMLIYFYAKYLDLKSTPSDFRELNNWKHDSECS